MTEQFRNTDISRWPQAVRVEWKREDIRDDTSDRPDQRDDGFWPSRDPEAAGYVLPENFDEEWRKAEERMRAWKDDEWCYIGVRAKATIYVPIGGNSFSIFTLTSPGLWGVESDGGEYLDEIFEEEKSGLISAIKAMGEWASTETRD